MAMNRLVRAAEEGNERKVARLLDAYPELLEVEEEAKLVPLKVAAKHGRLGVVKLLIQRGADPNATGASWKTALYHATYRADGEMVAFLLDNGAAAHIADILDITPLMLACTNCCIEIVEKIAQHIGPGELEEKDDEGKTALHYAAESNDVEALVFLLSLGADAGSRDEGGRTPLFDTCLKGHLEAVQVLVEHTGPQVLKDVDDGENTLLHYAVSNFLVSNPYCENKIAALVRFLLLNGADATARNDGGKTALDVLQDEEPCSSLAVLKWWEGELERRAVLHRAICLHKAYMTQRDQPTSLVPTYLKARVAAGHAVASVEVVALESERRITRSMARTAQASSKRKAAGGRGNEAQDEVGEEEQHAMLEYVMTSLSEELLTELLEGFY